jgi:hypothetical protein
VLHDYFRASSVAAVQARMNVDDDSPLTAFDGEDLKNLDPTSVLGQFVRRAGHQGDTDIGTDLIWPADPTEWEGPWVVVLDDETRDTLAGITTDELPALAQPDIVLEPAQRLVALAARARDAGEPLFCWISL